MEDITFEEVDYWEETCQILDWAETHVTSTLHICWAAQAGFYHYYGINKRQLPQKLFGIYAHKVSNRKVPLVRGFDDIFMAPHSRATDVRLSDVEAIPELEVMAVTEGGSLEIGRRIPGNGGRGQKEFCSGPSGI